MILDCVRLEPASELGYALVTTRPVRCGTVTMVECARCGRITPAEARAAGRLAFVTSHAPITRWTYPDFLEPCDPRIYYGNHSCDANTLDTHLGFDIAVRDIPAGTELSVDYRRFLDRTIDFPCRCRAVRCCGRVRCLAVPAEVEEVWSQRLTAALERVPRLEQPLLFRPEAALARQRYRAWTASRRAPSG
ncbi:MAG TPA: SET domain-containing protein [Longimicrobium sp.]|nr:SET domain-containing protein [Longimicrobium sp.]